MSDPAKDMALLDKALAVVSEHFDSVQIFANRHEAGELNGTVRVSKGTGNWFARYGQVRNWVIAEEESTRQDVRRGLEDGNG